jgi:hypothetical protein
MNLPDFNFKKYVLILEYISWQNAKCTKINCIIPALDIRWTGRSAVSHTFVKWWESSKGVNNNMIVINNDFIHDHNIINIIKENN